jgi:hypothetical protein
VPRRGVPPPLRSASAVSHDLDGLLLPGPGGVFRPLTPMRFWAPLPRSNPDRVDPRAAVSGCGGRAFGTRRSRLVPCGRRTRPKPRHRPRLEPPLRSLARPLRRPDPLLRFASPVVGPPSGHPDVRLPASRLQAAPSGFPRPSRPLLVVAAASCPDPFGLAPLQGLPSSHCPGLPPACYRGRRPVPPGTNRLRPRERGLLRSACAPDRRASRRPGRSRLPASPIVVRSSLPRRVWRVFFRWVPAPRTRMKL